MNPISVRNLTLGTGRPKICVPLVNKSPEALLSDAGLLLTLPADIAEWRADWMENILKEGCLEEILPRLRQTLGELPLLFTFRSRREGGEMEISEEKYVSLVSRAISSGYIDLVDLELFSSETSVKKLISLAREHHVATVLSNHDFFSTPSVDEMFSRLKKMEELGADIAKIAVMPRREEDVLSLLSVTVRAKKELSCPVVTMSMTWDGMVSRICGEWFGSCITFGCGKNASAPGQMDAEDLNTILNLIHGSR